MTKNTNKRIIHHAAQGCADFPPSSLSALESCLSQGALAIEVDTFPTADGHYVLLHDLNLENHTNGSGNAAALKRKDLEILSYKTHGQPTHEKLGFLDEAVGLISQNTSIEKLQLDLKPYGKLDAAALEKIVSLIDPIKTKVQVSSVADWLIRTLHNIEPGLSLGLTHCSILISLKMNRARKAFRPLEWGLMAIWMITHWQQGNGDLSKIILQPALKP